MAAREMTVREVLEATIGILGNMRIPINQIDDLATPIRQAIGNLRMCIDAMDKAAEEANDGREADAE